MSVWYDSLSDVLWASIRHVVERAVMSRTPTETDSPWAPFDEAALDDVLHVAAAYLRSERDEPAIPQRPGRDLRAEVDLTLPSVGRSRATVMDRLAALLAATPRAAGPRFLNQLYGGRDTVATITEMVSVLANTQMHTYKVAGVQTLIEESVVRHMAGKVGFGDAEGTLTPGGSLSNLVAMVVARNEAMPDVRESGLSAPGTVYTSTESHYSIRKNMGLIGLGRSRLRAVPVDRTGGMDPEALEAMIVADRAAGSRPVMINATAGTTVRGAFDPLPAIGAVARRHDVWFHVDGSYGGTVLLSPRYRGLLEGAAEADSFAWNPHKMMGMPLLCSVILLRRRGLLGKHFDETADYLFQTEDSALEPGRRSIQCGRRNDALKLWCAWQHHGDEGWARRVERQFELAAAFADLVRADPAMHLTEAPPSINICFEVEGRSSEAICDWLAREGRMLIGHGVVEGRRVLRMVCVDPSLHEDDLRDALAEIRRAAAESPVADNVVAPVRSAVPA